MNFYFFIAFNNFFEPLNIISSSLDSQFNHRISRIFLFPLYLIYADLLLSLYSISGPPFNLLAFAIKKAKPLIILKSFASFKLIHFIKKGSDIFTSLPSELHCAKIYLNGYILEFIRFGVQVMMFHVLFYILTSYLPCCKIESFIFYLLPFAIAACAAASLAIGTRNGEQET